MCEIINNGGINVIVESTIDHILVCPVDTIDGYDVEADIIATVEEQVAGYSAEKKEYFVNRCIDLIDYKLVCELDLQFEAEIHMVAMSYQSSFCAARNMRSYITLEDLYDEPEDYWAWYADALEEAVQEVSEDFEEVWENYQKTLDN